MCGVSESPVELGPRTSTEGASCPGDVAFGEGAYVSDGM